MIINEIFTNPKTKRKAFLLVFSIQIILAVILSNYFSLAPAECRTMHEEIVCTMKITDKQLVNKEHKIFGIQPDLATKITQVILPEVDDLYDSLEKEDWVIKQRGDTLFTCLHATKSGRIVKYTFVPYCRKYYPCLAVDESQRPKKQYDSLNMLLLPTIVPKAE